MSPCSVVNHAFQAAAGPETWLSLSCQTPGRIATFGGVVPAGGGVAGGATVNDTLIWRHVAARRLRDGRRDGRIIPPMVFAVLLGASTTPVVLVPGKAGLGGAITSTPRLAAPSYQMSRVSDW